MLVPLQPVEGEIVPVEGVVAGRSHHAEEGAVEGVVVPAREEEVVAGEGGVGFEFLGLGLLVGVDGVGSKVGSFKIWEQ